MPYAVEVFFVNRIAQANNGEANVLKIRGSNSKVEGGLTQPAVEPLSRFRRFAIGVGGYHENTSMTGLKLKK